MTGRGFAGVLLVALVAGGTLTVLGGSRERAVAAAAGVRNYEITMKFWKATVAEVPTVAVTNLPPDAIAYEGDTVVFTVRNESPIPEGFSIDAFGIREALEPKQTKTIRVSNVKAGAHLIYCHLHPYSVHYPGTLLVLPRQ